MAKKHKGRERAKSDAWLSYIRAGEKAREGYDELASEVMAYMAAHHRNLRDELMGKFADYGNLFVSVNTSAKIRMTLGPKLYQQNPVREVIPTTRDSVMHAQASVLERYINYTPNETHLSDEFRDAIDDCLLRGRGVMRTGFHADKEVITSWAIPSTSFVIDPDASGLNDAEWVAIKRREPLFRARRRFQDMLKKGEHWRLDGLEANVATPEGDTTAEDFGTPIDGEEREISGTNELLEYYEIYSRMGDGATRGLSANEDHKNDDDRHDFVYLVVARGHGCPLVQSDWDIPLYLDGEWPVVVMDFVTPIKGDEKNGGQLWPTSLFGLGLGHQKAIDTYSTIQLHTGKAHASERYFVDGSILEDDQIKKICYGAPTEVIKVNLKQGARIADAAQRMDTGVISPEISRDRDYHQNELNQLTGTVPVNTGGSEPIAQERSATAATLKKQAADLRTGDMGDKVENFAAALGRHEALAVRLSTMVDDEDVEAVVRDAELGYLISVQFGPTEMPVRNRTTEEELESKARGKLKREADGKSRKELIDYAQQEGLGDYAVEDVDPRLAIYFPDEQTAQTAQQVFLASLQEKARTDPRARELWSWLFSEQNVIAEPVTQGDGSVKNQVVGTKAIQARKVTIADVWRDTSGISPKELMREYCYTVRAGSTQKVTPERKVEMAQELMQTGFPAALQLAQATGNMEVVNAIWGYYQDSLGIPDDERMPEFAPPPPPMPAGPPPQGAPA